MLELELERLFWVRFWSDLLSLLRKTIADDMTLSLPPSAAFCLPSRFLQQTFRDRPGIRDTTGHAILPSRTQSNAEIHSSQGITPNRTVGLQWELFVVLVPPPKEEVTTRTMDDGLRAIGAVRKSVEGGLAAFPPLLYVPGQ